MTPGSARTDALEILGRGYRTEITMSVTRQLALLGILALVSSVHLASQQGPNPDRVLLHVQSQLRLHPPATAIRPLTLLEPIRLPNSRSALGPGQGKVRHTTTRSLN